jgi:hypothetical protein
MFVIEDEVHADQYGMYSTLDETTEGLRWLASIPWSERPNLPPCTNWRTCERKYELVEYDASQTPWQERQRIPALNISASAVVWVLPAA